MSKPTHPKNNDQTNAKLNQTLAQNTIDTTSSEAAGIVRGSLRTIRKTIENSPSTRTSSATTTTAAAAVGRTTTKRVASEAPVIYPSFNKTSVASEPPVINSSYKKTSLWKIFALPKRTWKIKRIPSKKPVVKASEHLMHDVTSKVLGKEEEGKIKQQDTESLRKNEHGRQQLTSWRNLTSKAYFISSSLVKNTVIGIAVFETYEHVIDHFEKSTLENNFHTTTSTTITAKEEEEDPRNCVPKSFFFSNMNDGTSLAQHFFAGTAAGSVHSILHLSFESISFFKLHRFHVNVYPTLTSLLSHGTRDMIHHGLSHALMFSSYEAIKRLLSFTIYNDRKATYNIGQKHDTVSFLNILLIGVAGGVAGQVHHVASHVTESLLFVKDHRQQEQQARSIKTISNVLPCSRSIARSFLPSALGFIAFEFGKRLV
eukprot:CAMPEP_0176488592 /NCGR_PEP_ID=MMETSP0200_2-20121128/6797_1 /TAXON_ID=947934 /ORGANISM="Chaetoceros sp., Strain GSL56" /LENGTH=427 /DNA_ID=CAMNT_0017885597 /DNA_START=28 /DNA_END=1311 /DNA_ORIENTATION=+